MDKDLRALLVQKAEQWAIKRYRTSTVIGYIPTKIPARFTDATLIWEIELEVEGVDGLISVEVHIDEDGNIQVVA